MVKCQQPFQSSPEKMLFSYRLWKSNEYFFIIRCFVFKVYSEDIEK